MRGIQEDSEGFRWIQIQFQKDLGGFNGFGGMRKDSEAFMGIQRAQEDSQRVGRIHVNSMYSPRRKVTTWTYISRFVQDVWRAGAKTESHYMVLHRAIGLYIGSPIIYFFSDVFFLYINIFSVSQSTKTTLPGHGFLLQPHTLWLLGPRS